MYGAIQANHMNNVKWIYQCGGFELEYDHFYWAAEYGTLGIMKWLREVGCPWNTWTFAEAAEHGDLNNLMWLKATDCPWDVYTFGSASVCGNLEVLDWLLVNNCPWNTNTFQEYEYSDSVAQWLLNHSMIA